MLSYCLKCRKNTESNIPKVLKAKDGRIKPLPRSAVRDGKKSRFIKEQEACGALGVLINILSTHFTFLAS